MRGGETLRLLLLLALLSVRLVLALLSVRLVLALLAARLVLSLLSSPPLRFGLGAVIARADFESRDDLLLDFFCR